MRRTVHVERDGVHDAYMCFNNLTSRMNVRCNSLSPNANAEFVPRSADGGVEIMAREGVESEHDADIGLGPGFARAKATVLIGRSRSTSSRSRSRRESTKCS